MKKYFFIFVLLICSLKPLNAQMGETPVIDITNIATAIENGFTMYQQLQADLESLKNTYEQLNAIKEQMMNFDFSSYDWTKWDAFLHATDDFMDLQDDLSATIKRKNMKVGNLNFSLEDLFEKDTYKNLLNEAEQKLDPNNMTDADRTAFINRHGMSPKHYHTLVALDKELTEKAREVLATHDKRKNITDNLVNTLGEFESQIQPDTQLQELQSLQLQSQMMQYQNECLFLCAKSIQELNENQAIMAQKQIEMNNEKQEVIMEVSDSFNDYEFSLNQNDLCDEDSLLNPFQEGIKIKY